MATYYVREQGAVVRKQDERLVVTKDRAIVAEIPMHQLDQLVVMGNIQLTTPAVGILLQSEVDVVFMTIHGRVRGRLMANESKFAELRLKQLQMMTNEQANLAVAKPIVAVTRALKAENADSLRGFEGKAGAWYWPAFKTLLKRDLGFAGRNYYPPKDPV